nr:ABC transporter ATP-binding protein [Nocardiopsis kunsanensis]
MAEYPPGRAADPATGAPIETVVGVEGLRMDYGSTRVLDGLGLTVRAGEVVALLGPNGAGKTTTIEILEGFRRRSAGRVEVLGQDPARAGEAWRADLGVVLQSWRDHGVWRVRELLHHFGRYYAAYSTPERVRPFDTDVLLDRVGLAGHARRQVKSLSGGQRRRLDVAIGLVGRPRLLFLDEPTAGFDPQARRNFHDLVHDVVDENDTAVLLTTHDLDEAERLADRILVLTGGRIVADGSAEQLATGLGGDSEVAWTVDGRRSVHSTRAPVEFVAGLYADHGDSVTDLRVTRPTLEDVYMDLVRRHESGDIENAAAEFERTVR